MNSEWAVREGLLSPPISTALWLPHVTTYSGCSPANASSSSPTKACAHRVMNLMYVSGWGPVQEKEQGWGGSQLSRGSESTKQSRHRNKGCWCLHFKLQPALEIYQHNTIPADGWRITLLRPVSKICSPGYLFANAVRLICPASKNK